MLDMLFKIVISAVSDAPELAPAEREQELEIGRCCGVEGQLLRTMVT